MRQFATIAINAFMELVRQPIFLLLTTATAAFEIFLATPYYFAFGDEPKLVKNSVLAVMLLAGLFGAVLTASSSLGREIRTGTALAVLSKPIGRAQFLLAKYAGLVVALTLMTYVNMLAALIASRMAFDAYGSTDLGALGIFAGGVVAAYAIAGFSNFFLRRTFVSDAFFALIVMLSHTGPRTDFHVHQTKIQPWPDGERGLAAGAGSNINLIRALDTRLARFGVFDARGHNSDTGDLLGDFSGWHHVGLSFWYARGERLLVGVRSLHGYAKLAAFLARGRAGNGQDHVPLGLCWQGIRLRRGLCRRGPVPGDFVV